MYFHTIITHDAMHFQIESGEISSMPFIPPTLLLKSGDKKGLLAVYDSIQGEEDILYPIYEDGEYSVEYPGSYLSCMLAKKVTEGFFQNAELDENFAENLEYSLKDDFRAYLQLLEPEKESYIYPYTKRLAGNIAGIYFQQGDDSQTEIISFWTNSSCCFYLQKNGLTQTSEEYSTSPADLMDSLFHSPKLLNCINADTDFKIFSKRDTFLEPTLLLVCNPACLENLPSPFHFEFLLLKTLLDSTGFEHWKELLTQDLKAYATDTIFLSLKALNFQENIFYLKVYYFERYRELEKKYIHPMQEIDNALKILQYEEKYLKMKMEQLAMQRKELEQSLLQEYRSNTSNPNE